MKSICYVYNTSQYLYLHRFDLIKKMSKSGFTIYAIAPKDDYSDKIRGKNINFIELDIERKGYNIFNDMKYFYKLLKIYFNLKPSIVHHFTIKPIIYGTICARIIKVPKIINSINGLGYSLVNKGFKSFLARLGYKYSLYTRKVVNIFQNKDDLNYFVSNRMCYEKSAHLIQGCGVNLNRFRSTNKDDDWFNGDIKFLFLSRMLRDKGLIELVEAAKSLFIDNDKFELLLFGLPDEGNPESVTSSWLKKISEHPAINWVGYTDKSHKEIDRCHVMILPSYREGLSQSLLEGLAMGKPIITSNVPGCRELIYKNGYLVTPKDKNSIIQSMKEILENREILPSMSRNSKKMSKRFDVNKINYQLKKLYD